MQHSSRPPIPPERSYGRWHLAALVLALVLSILITVLTTPVDAQTVPTPDLVVTLRDVQGAPVAGAQVIVRDSVAGTDVVRTTTDAAGRVTVGHVPVNTVRVAVSGTLHGLTLHQVGQDAPGVALTLGSPPTTLDLRVDTDGSVLPGPATMISPDLPVPIGTPAVSTRPTAPRALALRAPTRTLPTVRPTGMIYSTTVEMAPLTPTPIALDTAEAADQRPVTLLVLLLLALGGIAVYVAWRKL